MKPNKIFIGALFTGVLVIGCGSGGNINKVCGAATDELFIKCDQNNPADVQTIWNALQGAGVSISAAEIQSGSKGQVIDACVKALNDAKAEITDPQATLAIDAFKATTTCQEIVSLITGELNTI